MKTKDFLKQHSACKDGAKWALSIGEDMVDVWEALIREGRHEWLLWTATRPGVFPDSTLRKFACRFVRETPLHDGRKVLDLLIDKRSRKAIEVAELYADGKATYEKLDATYAAACAAYATDSTYADYAAARAAAAATYAAVCVAASSAAYAAASSAAYDAARVAARDAAYAAAAARAAKAAQAQMIAEMGNPFKERATR